MNTVMNGLHIDTLDKVDQFLDGTDEVELAITGKQDRYDFIKRTLIRFKYRYLSRQDKGLILRYIARISGYSHVQVNALQPVLLRTGVYNGAIPPHVDLLDDTHR